MSSSRIWILVTAALLMSACSDGGQREHKAAKSFSDFDTLTVEQSACLFERINALIKAIDMVNGTGTLLEQRQRAKQSYAVSH